MHFAHILIALFILFFGILFPMIFFGYRNGIRKKNKDNGHSGFWKSIFHTALVIAFIVIAGIVFVVLLGAAMSSSFS